MRSKLHEAKPTRSMYDVLFFLAFDLNDDFDEEYAVQEVVHNMLGKDLVNVGSLDTNPLRSKVKTFKDPTRTMELRHKEVCVVQ